MTAKGKLKYVIAAIVLFVLFILTTCYPIKKDIMQAGTKIDTAVIDLTYGLLLLSAFAFGGAVTGISSTLGVGLYILMNNKSPWLALIALIVGIVAGITIKLTTYLREKKKLDAKGLLISAAAFFIGFGVIFTVARVINGAFYFTSNSQAIRFCLPLCILPYIIGVMFIVAAVLENKMQENLQIATCKAAFMMTSVITIYTIMAFLCSLSTKLSIEKILAKTYRTYLVNFYLSALIGFLAAIVIYLIIYIIVALRRKFTNALKDVE